MIDQHSDNQNQDRVWYIVKQTNQTCEIVLAKAPPSTESKWGPFASQSEAIAKRVGLIRAGLCQPQ